MSVYSLSDLKADHTRRFSSTFDELDWAYGRPGEYGMPEGRISLWSGGHGVGKTRLAAELMKRWAKIGVSSLIFQGEVSPEQFKGEKMGDFESDLIGVSPDTELQTQLDIIMDTGPHVAIFDSVQQIEEYKGGSGAKEIISKLRQVIEATKTHVIFLSQLSKDGKTKGRANLPHFVDIETTLTRSNEYLFEMEFQKNRYGISGRKLMFCHLIWHSSGKNDEGIDCQSFQRYDDPDWVKLTKKQKAQDPDYIRLHDFVINIGSKPQRRSAWQDFKDGFLGRH